MAEPDILTRMQMFINGEILLSEPEKRALCRDAAAMLEETMPSSPMLQAARKRSGPISPCSKGLMKMPSGRRASSRSR